MKRDCRDIVTLGLTGKQTTGSLEEPCGARFWVDGKTVRKLAPTPVQRRFELGWFHVLRGGSEMAV